jgi:Ni,Fe-hydrogenase III component G
VIKNMWGGILNPGATSGEDKILRVRSGSAELSRLLAHWAAMPDSERPVLHGLSATAGAGNSKPTLELLLSQGKGAPLAVLEISPAANFARPSKVWPHSLWWEEELRNFSGVVFTGLIPERDATWRPL